MNSCHEIPDDHDVPTRFLSADVVELNNTQRMWTVAFVCAVYTGTFLFGFVGNLWVMVALYRARKNFRLFCFNSSRTVPIPQTPSERLRAFIFVLAMTDFLVLLTVPLSLYHILSGSWPFGQPLCKIHTAIDRGGKLFSVVILTAMSLQRYLVICTRWRYIASTTKTIFVPILIGIIACVFVPIFWESRYTDTIYIHFDLNASQIICLTRMPQRLELYFVNYTFMCGFTIPLCVMAICYFMLVRHVRNKFQERKGYGMLKVRRPRYMCELTKSIWRISIFHFTCWGPFWFFTASPFLAKLLQLPEFDTNSTWFKTGQLIGNMLPYVNSAGNWILYAFLNRDVRHHIIRRASKNKNKNGFLPITVSYRPTVA